MAHRFLSLPVRSALAGLSWASLSVSMLPTEELKRARRLEAEQLTLFDLKPEKRPPLHPLAGRRFPVERFFFWAGRASKTGQAGGNFAAANTAGFKSKAAAVSILAGSA